MQKMTTQPQRTAARSGTLPSQAPVQLTPSHVSKTASPKHACDCSPKGFSGAGVIPGKV